MRRVAVTGIGVVCAVGNNRCQFQRALNEGRCGIGGIASTAGTDLRFRNGAEIKDFSVEDHFSLKEADMIDRFAQLAVVAAREAAAQSGIEWTPDLRENAGIVTGSCVGGQRYRESGLLRRLQDGQKPRPSHDHSKDHGERRRQRHLA